MNPMAPAPIGDYGLIGDTRTAALVSSDGAIDWLCFPRFDSPPLFGRLVSGVGGGTFEVGVENVLATDRRYRHGSAVLETTWRADSGVATLVDGMVADTGGALLPQGLLVRELVCREGRIRARVRFDPRRGWAGESPHVERWHGRLLCRWRRLTATLACAPDLQLRPSTDEWIELAAGRRLILVLALDDGGPATLPDPDDARRRLDETDRWWERWSSGLRVAPGGDADPVRRSLITLRLLTYSPSGAPVAAPTTSLPEVPGGSRNWDYRAAWVRDASMGTMAFLAAGSTTESRSFLWWMLHASRRTRPGLRVVYDLAGGNDIGERELPDLPGYRGARPVRVGNAAADQFQLDAHAWMLDAGWAYLRATDDLYGETWRALRGHADALAERWHEPDHGIWEVRGEPRHFVHSKLMAWHGLDRAALMAGRLRAGRGRAERWSSARDRVGEEVRRRGFDPEVGGYVQAFGTRDLDAAVLSLALTRIESRDSVRLRGTIDAIRRELGAGGPLLYRYSPQGEGAFLPCSFWLSRALAATGRVDEAREVFDETCALATAVGLFAEEMDPSTHEHTGNFPQAFTHSALVLAADELARAERWVRGRGTRRGSRRTPRAPRSLRAGSRARS